MMPLEISKGTSMKPKPAAVGVKIVNRDQSTTPAPSTTLEEYLVATYPPASHTDDVRQDVRAWAACSLSHAEPDA